ncbi:unnamed protein product [Trichobilharzia regenti]|nr:unnamed protein product [Trichobilharzia regenti]
MIPVNLVVRQLGSTWARIGWEMPNIPQSVKMSISGFQVKYYQVKSSSQDEYKNELEDSISIGEKSSTEQSVDKSHEMKFINMTVSPNQFQAENFDLTLRNLKPATQYEFGVRMLNNEMTIDRHDIDNHQRTAKNYFWSMVQGFETFGRSKMLSKLFIVKHISYVLPFCNFLTKIKI